MRNKVLFIVLIFLLTVGAWVITFLTNNSKEDRFISIKAQVKENEELGIYKKNIALYKELISMEKENIQWYEKLADSYYHLEKYGDYENACMDIIKAFPEDALGYIKLGEYYRQNGRVDEVIELYSSLPESIKEDKTLKALYEKSEFEYTYRGSTCDEIIPFLSYLTVVRKGESYIYVDYTGSQAFEREYDLARPFIEDMAAVFYDNEWYMIDKEGDKIAATKELVQDLYSISEGYAVAKFNGMYGYVDENFKKFHIEYDNATNFYNNVAAVQVNGKWKLISKEFKDITDAIYDEIIVDENNICTRGGVIFAKKGENYHMLNLSGKEITNEVFEDARIFVSKEPVAVKKNGKWGFIDTEGKKVIDFKYDDAYSFSLGLAPVCIDGIWGYIDQKEEMKVPRIFDESKPFYKTGIAVVKYGNTYRFIQLIKYE
ncbi:MAG: hypothetical protein GX367_02835 [Bacteroidales bacterium]|nr:hypothetical protein [Bacteroidales bacterium]